MATNWRDDLRCRVGRAMMAAALDPRPELGALQGYAQGMLEEGVPEEVVRQIYEEVRLGYSVEEVPPDWDTLMSMSDRRGPESTSPA